MLALADAGIAVVGTLVGALAVQTRARDLIVPLIGAAAAHPGASSARRRAAPAARGGGAAARRSRALAASSALYDLVFGLLAYAVFDYLLED